MFCVMTPTMSTLSSCKCAHRVVLTIWPCKVHSAVLGNQNAFHHSLGDERNFLVDHSQTNLDHVAADLSGTRVSR